MWKKCTPLWREAHLEAHLEIKMCYHTSVGALLDVVSKKSCRCGAKHLWKSKCTNHTSVAVAARSTFPSQNVQSTPGSEYFWKLRCRKSARRCGAKHISKFSKSKVQKIDGYGTLFDLQKFIFWWLAQDIEK